MGRSRRYGCHQLVTGRAGGGSHGNRMQTIRSPRRRRSTMRTTTNIALAAVLVLGSVSTPSAANHAAHRRHPYAMAPVSLPNLSGGRLVEAPPWSFAGKPEHGPSPCGERIWAY